jgi:S1-C subfamily serine protease
MAFSIDIWTSKRCRGRAVPCRAWKVRVLLPVALLGLAAAAPAVGVESQQSAILQISTHAVPKDYAIPWQRGEAEQMIGAGVLIPGDRILTNAHVVADGVLIEVRREGRAGRVQAEVEHICHPCDLALLRVSDPAFFKGVEPLTLGPVPKLQDRVDVFGFPVGGESLSITSGVVSRIEVNVYSHSLDELLMVQIDAAVNPGNSGGPALSGGKIAGIATQVLSEAENVGYIVPTPIIQHFLADVADGSFDGFPLLGVDIQPVDNAALRAFLRLSATAVGALVYRIDHGSPAWGKLLPGDVIVSLDGVGIEEDLAAPVAGLGRVHFSHLVRMRQMGDTMRVDLYRDGQPRTEEVVLEPWKPLVPNMYHFARPPYLMFGGLVFQPLTPEYFSLYETAPANLIPYLADENVATPERREVIVLSQVLAHPVNRGYTRIHDAIVAEVEGNAPRDLEHLVQLVEAAAGPWLEIRTESGMRLVLDLARAKAATAGIMETYGLAADRYLAPSR